MLQDDSRGSLLLAFLGVSGFLTLPFDLFGHQSFALLFSRGGSVALRAARVCALVCMGSRARPSFASGGPGRWVDEAEPLSVQLVLGWTSRRALHRVRKLSRRHSRCH